MQTERREEEETQDEEEVEEGQEPNMICKPCRPSQEEVDKHNETHIPFRSWCEICVKARGVEAAHKLQEKGPRDTPRVRIDYRYFKEGYITGVEESGTGRPILGIKDDESKWLAAHQVERKGDYAYAVVALLREIEKILGYKRIILSSDQEGSILNLQRKVKALAKIDIIMEETPVGDHQSAGSIESGIRLIQAYSRTYRLALETRLQAEIPEDHKIMP
jgi:hypothetical protein